MQDAYFLNTSLSNASSEIVKNDIVLDKKLIITGPNAAGKTTIIKTTLFNVLLSQQFGYGVYKTATIVPYHFLHCYLNIPDTSGRDSLFQAESRRCKEILDCITTHASKRHFGIFDELYSGTNPYEAVASAYGYIHHISEMKNVDFMLTTHYIHLCELFEPTNMRKKKKHNHKHKHKVSASASSTSSKDKNREIGRKR
jgi:DNA mismatch repair ATPase MutS